MKTTRLMAALAATALLAACGEKAATPSAPPSAAPAATSAAAPAGGAASGATKPAGAAGGAAPSAGAAPATTGAGPSGGPPPPSVGVIKVKTEEASLVNELPGRLEALRVAQIRARVPGVVQKRLFQEGSDIKAGQVLYQLDPAPFKATLDSALASVKKAEASLMQTTATVKRFKPLVDVNAVSQQEYTNAQAAQKQAEADLALSRASVQTARINLGYTNISAPIAGRIGRTLVSEGALVGQGEATQMAVIQQVNPLFVNFTQPAADVLRLKQSIAAGKLKDAGKSDGAAVRVMLEDGTAYPHSGKLLFADLTVDQASGQITMRAELPNPDGLLLPGMYVRVRLEQARYDAVILVPQQAVTRSGQGDTVNVVDDKGMVSPRPVKLGSSQGNRWIVTEGLKPGEAVMVDGFQKLRPGLAVNPVPWQPVPAPAPAPAAK